MDPSFVHQNAAPGDLGIFLDDQRIAIVPAAEHWSAAYDVRDRLAAEHGMEPNRYEVLKLCPVHPDVSAVDCADCVPLD